MSRQNSSLSRAFTDSARSMAVGLFADVALYSALRAQVWLRSAAATAFSRTLQGRS